MKRILQLLFLILALTVTMPAYAVTQAKGEVPNLAPLQPAPDGIAPNYSKNVQFSNPTYSGQSDTSTGSDVSGQNNNSVEGDTNSSDGNSSNSSGFPSPWILVVIILVGGGALFWMWRRSKRL